MEPKPTFQEFIQANLLQIDAERYKELQKEFARYHAVFTLLREQGGDTVPVMKMIAPVSSEICRLEARALEVARIRHEERTKRSDK